MITKEAIEAAKSETKYRHRKDILHEHDDCIRMAYEWLDAQKKTKTKCSKTYALKHIIEKWAGRYVSQSDVEVAAHLHPEIFGTYPEYNISAKLTLPNDGRLEGIAEAFSQDYRENLDLRVYSRKE